MIPPFPHLPGYSLDGLIGRGAFGTVYRARWDGSYVCALKVLEKGGAPHLPYLGTVLEKLRELPEHPGLLQVYAFDLAAEVPHLSMALLPENAATADQLSGQVTEEEAWGLLRQLSDTLAWMHGHGLAHAGLTAGNVVVVGTERGVPQVMVTDAGQAWLGDGPMDRLHDQAACLPPERWREPGWLLRNGGGESWDVYAFGVIAWRLLTGDWPRGADVFERVLTTRSEGLSIDPPAFAGWLSKEPAARWPTRALHGWEKSCREMVLSCLELDPAKRPESMMEVALVLRKAPALKRPLGAADGSEAGVGADGGSHSATAGPDWKPQAAPPPPEPVEVVDWLGGEEWPTAPATWEPAANLPRSRTPATPVPAPAPPPEAVSEPEVLTISEPLPPPASPRPAAPKPAPQSAAPTVHSVDKVHPVHTVHPAPIPTAPSPPPAAAPQPAAASAGKAPASRRWLVEAAAAVLMLAAALYALHLKSTSDRSRAALGQAGAAAEDAEKRAADSAAQATILKKRVEEQRVREMTALRDSSAATVAKMLESAPAEPAGRGVWRAAAAPVAEQLRQALDACDAVPALTVSSMEARWRLADLYTAMEKPESARPLLERLASDLEKAAPPAPGDAAQEDALRLLKAQTAARRGALLQEAGQSAEALPLLSLASAAFEQWLPGHPDRADVARDFAQNALREGRALRESKKTAEAKKALTLVTTLLPKPNAPDFPADAAAFTLADALNGLAELAEAEGQLQEAIGFRTGLVQALLTYDARHPKSVPCRSRMTESLLTMGQNLSALGAQQDALQTLQRAVKLLSELSAESPDDPGFNLQTARAYSEVAQVLQAANPTPAGAKSALDYSQGAEGILRRLTQASPGDDNLKLRLASTLVQNGELRAAAGDSPGDLIPGLDESVTLATQLNLGTSLDDARRAECRKIGARAWAVIGDVLEKTGNKTGAAASFNKALEVWSALAATDPAARRLETTTRERLKKLQPGG